MTRPLTKLELLALEMAALGCVAGRLEEWPHLRSALEALGLPAWPDLGAEPMRLLAKDALRLLAIRALIGP